MRVRHVLLYKNGESNLEAMGDLGCYEGWFARALGPEVRLEVHKGFDAPHRSILGYDGLLLTGSPRSLAEPEPWMDEAAAFVRKVAHFGLPILGVCFGHQLLGYAYGGKVRQNPRGWEAGTVTVHLSEAGRRDPLFAGVADEEGRVQVNQSHRDEIEHLGPDMTLLAHNEHSAVQAIGVGDHVRGVQFHPEMTAREVRRLIAHRAPTLDEDARVKGCPERRTEERLARVRDTPEARRLLDNWLRHFVWHA